MASHHPESPVEMPNGNMSVSQLGISKKDDLAFERSLPMHIKELWRSGEFDEPFEHVHAIHCISKDKAIKVCICKALCAYEIIGDVHDTNELQLCIRTSILWQIETTLAPGD